MLQNYLCIKSSTQLKKIEQNQLEYLAYLPNKLGCDVQNISGVTIINCSLDTTIVYGAPQHVNYALAAIKNICTRQALSWWIPPSERNPHITTELIANGLSVQSINAAMFGNVSTAVSVQQHPNLCISQVTNSIMMADFISVLENCAAHTAKFYAQINYQLCQGRERIFVGYVHGKPVSIGIVFLSGDSAGIFSLLTQTDAQGKGYTTAMMGYLMQVTSSHGCDFVSTVVAQGDWCAIYKHFGFAQVGQFECLSYT